MTPGQFETIMRQIDRLQGETGETTQAARALRLKVDGLPTLRDIYRESFRLWALTFGPVIDALLLMLLWAYVAH